MIRKTVLITGASSGIGWAAAEIFAINHYKIIIAARRKERLNMLAEELRKKYAAEVLALVIDIRNRQQVQHSLDNLPAEWSEIDILVNNAGLAAGFDPVHKAEIDDWERMIDTNVKGLLYITRFVAPGMAARRSGHIINVGSIAGKETYINGNVYCATKHAVDSLTQAMRMDLLRFGIRVTQIAPGATETEFSMVRFHGDAEASKNVYKGFVPLSAEDVADAIYYASTRPPHVCINDLVIMPAAQANTVHWHKVSE